MATRALIGVYTDDPSKGQWRGTYHHWDGYPSGLGKALWNLYHEAYENILPAMVEMLIDAHPEGWSSIVGADWSLRPCWLEPGERSMFYAADHALPPQSYKYRGESPSPADHTSDMGQEWAYVFDLKANTMTILDCMGSEDLIDYAIKATVPLNGTEPNWTDFE